MRRKSGAKPYVGLNRISELVRARRRLLGRVLNIESLEERRVLDTGWAAFANYQLDHGQHQGPGGAVPVQSTSYYSLNRAASVTNSDNSSIFVDDSDIVMLTQFTDGSWQHELLFDGNDVGLSTPGENIDAFSIRSDGSILISTSWYARVPGLTAAAPEDVLLFTPTLLGDYTRGVWSLYVDGSDIGLDRHGNIDALTELPDGRLVFSVDKLAQIPGVPQRPVDEDLIAVQLTSTGEDTQGTLQFYLDGSDIGLSANAEDINALAIEPNGTTIHFSTLTRIVAAGIDATGRDVVTFNATRLGRTTQGSYDSQLFLEGAQKGIEYPPYIDGFSLAAIEDPAQFPPLINSIQDAVIHEFEPFSFTATAQDADTPSSELRWSIVQAPLLTSIDPVSGLFTWTPVDSQGPRTFEIILAVSDGVSTSQRSFTVQVQEVNVAPRIEALADQTVPQGTTVNLVAVGSDQDLPRRPLTYSLSEAPEGATINSSSGAISWEASSVGTATFRVRVTDNEGLFAETTFNINVFGPIDIDTILDKEIDEQSELNFLITAAAGAPDSSFIWSLVSGPTGATIDPQSGLFTWTPTESQGPDNVSITVAVTDGTFFDQETFSVVVHEVNLAPTIAPINDFVVSAQGPISLTVSAVDPDVPSNLLTYSIESGPVGASIDPQTGALTWTPVANGTYDFIVKAIDNGVPSLSDIEEFSILIDAFPSDNITLSEGAFASEATVVVELGQLVGTRSLRFKLDAFFDVSDNSSAISDLLNVYLVDPNNQSQTLLDRGEVGTAIFSVNEQGLFEVAAGLVQYDGQYVTIDLTSLENQSEALLKFQLLNHDTDNSGYVVLSELTNVVDPDGKPSQFLLQTSFVATTGGTLDFDSLNPSNAVKMNLENIRFDSYSGLYAAELKLSATSNVGSSVAVSFPGLPSEVQLLNSSGTTAGGVRYLNLAPALPQGGLRPNHPSQKILLQFANPLGLSIVIDPQIVVGLPNRTPTIAPVPALESFPGDALLVPLNISDPDNDQVTVTIRSNGPTPTMTLRADHSLLITPRPDEIGSYQFDVIVSDGVLEATQFVSVTVNEDPVTTTRISGIVLDTNGNPIAGIPVELGRHQAITQADGTFTIELPSFETPTEVFNIAVPLGDPQFDPFNTGDKIITLFRSGYDVTTGTSVDNPRLHPNLVSSYIDASVVYGSDATRAAALRLFTGGQLKTSVGNLLPINNAATFPNGMLENDNQSQFDPSTLFAAGDVRANENTALISLHTVLMREHNRKAIELANANPSWTDEMLYQEARRWVVAVMQQITYSEFLPLLLGSAAIPTYAGYDANTDPSVSGLFSATAFRFGHSISVPEFDRLDDAGQPLVNGPQSIREAFFNAEAIKQDGIEPYLKGMSTQVLEELDTTVIDELRNFLFGPPGAGGMDLVSLNIQRARDLGLPSYNQARRDFGLTPVSSFAEITSNTAVQGALSSIYATVEDIDVWVGGLAEDHVAGAMVGELFQAIIADQFIRFRSADRFWFENAQFSASELSELRSLTISQLILNNTSISLLPANGFTTLTNPAGPAAGGAAGMASEYRSFDGSGNNQNDLNLGRTGTNLLTNYTLEYGDGISTPAGADRASAREISNAVFGGTSGQTNSLGATNLFAIWGQLLTHDTNLTPGGTDDTLKVHGEMASSANAYPFVAEKLPLVFDGPVFIGANNVIARPIYLPALNTADAVTINPATDMTVTIPISTGAAPAKLFVQAGTLVDRQGNALSGPLSITEVPALLTPAVLPLEALPDTVVTIQPGNMVFNTPAPLTLPNRAGLAPGLLLDLWSINPTTGAFEVVGTGQVSVDGSVIETISGGVRNSSWHYFSMRETTVTVIPTALNPDTKCETCEEVYPANSVVSAHSGEVTETHSLVTYQSQGESRGVQLVYSSLRADPRPIIHGAIQVGVVGVAGLVGINSTLKAFADLSINQNGLQIQTNGSGAAIGGLASGANYWDVGGSSKLNLALQPDMTSLPTGYYQYSMRMGLVVVNDQGSITQSSGIRTSDKGDFLHINEIASPYGSGWGIAGLQYLVEDPSGSVLMVDGNGSELWFEVQPDGSYDSPPGHFSTLTKQLDGSYRHTTTEQTVYVFDANLRLISMTDRNGNATTYDYNNELLTSIADPVGLATTFNYTANKLTSIVDPAGRTSSMTYDANGNLTSVTDPDGTTRTWTYDDGHHMTGEVDQLGNSEHMEYDFAGRAIKSTRKDGTVLQYRPAQVAGLYPSQVTSNPDFSVATSNFAYPSDAPVAYFVDGNGQLTQSELTAGMQLVNDVDGIGDSGRTTYNSEALPSNFIDARGNETRITYDQNGNVVQIADVISSGAGSGGVRFPMLQQRPGEIFEGHVVDDLNGDGFLDVVTDTIIYYGNAAGGFNSPVDLNGVFLNDGFKRIKVLDLNGDGIKDIVSTSGVESLEGLSGSGMAVWLSNLDGTYADGIGYDTQVWPGQAFDDTRPDYRDTPLKQPGFAIADFNNDGFMDAVITQTTDVLDQMFAGGFLLFLGDGTGGFDGNFTFIQPDQSSFLDLPPWAWNIEAADLDHDGNQDVVISSARGIGAGPTTGEHQLTVMLGNGDGTFGNPTNYGTGFSDQAFLNPDAEDEPLLLQDINDDGFVDAIVASTVYAGMSVMLGDGLGGFQSAYVLPTSTQDDLGKGIFVTAIKTSDFNEDGHLDLAISDESKLSVSIWLGDGSGIFTTRNDYRALNRTGQSIPPFAQSLFISDPIDIDGDGDLDIPTVGNGFTPLINRGDGTFITWDQIQIADPLNNEPQQVEVIDIDGDSLNDLVTRTTSNGIEIRFGLGNRQFSAPLSLAGSGNATRDMIFGDFNGDSRPDIILTEVANSTIRYYKYENLGGRAFGSPQILPFTSAQTFSSSDKGFIVSANLNGDIFDDLALVDYQSKVVRIFTNDGSGGFIESTVDLTQAVTTTRPQQITTGDANGDGFADLVIGYNSTGVTSLLNDGLGNFTRIDGSTFSPQQIYLSDVDEDGIQDLIFASGNTLNYAIGDGMGHFSARVDIPLDSGAADRLAIDVGDFNSDGLPDIVAALNNHYEVFAGLAGGGFSSATYVMGGGISVGISDMDNDGIGDIVGSRIITDFRYSESVLTIHYGESQAATGPKLFTYDPVFNQLTSFTDELGHQTLFEIDPANGNTLSVTLVIGLPDSTSGETDDLVTSYAYTTAGLVQSMTDPLGRITLYEYDLYGRLTQLTLAAGTADEGIYQYVYDAAGNVTETIDPLGHNSFATYDSLDRVTSLTDASGATSTFEYDARGNVTRTVDRVGSEMTYVYDARDRVVAVTDSQSNTTQYVYDFNGNVVQTIDPLGQTMTYVYDVRDRVTQSVDPDGGVTRYFYDLNDNLTRLIDPVGNITQFVYDARNRQVAEVDPLGNRIEFDFDAANNLIAKTDRNGRVTRFTYDDVNRLVGESWLNANTTIANTITYAYDKASNLLSLVDDFSSLAWTYDARDRAISESNLGTPGAPEVQQTYSYDALGNLLTTSDTISGSAGATTNYLYDVLNRMTRITQTGSGGLTVADKRVDIAYNAIGQFSSIDRYSDLAGTQLVVGTSYQFDSINRLTNITHNNSSSTVAFYNFTYDADSRITSITDIDGATNYSYDSRDQLVGADHADTINPDENYSYDANGNRTDSQRHGNGYVTGPANRLLSDGVYSYTYDAEGNRILQTEIATGDYREFTYDHRNRLMLVVDYDSSDVEQQRVVFTYDVLGRRISKTIDNTTVTHFVYQGQDVILDFVDTDGLGGNAPVLSQRYLHGPAVDQVFAQEDAAGNVEWLLTDHLGTTGDIVDNLGQVVNHIKYDSFGNVIDQTNASESTRYLFTGRELDEEIGLMYYRTRYYDPSTGTFISEDTIGYSGGDMNLSRYVGNMATQRTDPSGRKPPQKFATFPSNKTTPSSSPKRSPSSVPAFNSDNAWAHDLRNTEQALADQSVNAGQLGAAVDLLKMSQDIANASVSYQRLIDANAKNRKFMKELAKRIPCGQKIRFIFTRNSAGEIQAIAPFPKDGIFEAPTFMGGDGTKPFLDTVTGTGDPNSFYFKGPGGVAGFGLDTPSQIQNKIYGVPLQPGQMR